MKVASVSSLETSHKNMDMVDNYLFKLYFIDIMWLVMVEKESNYQFINYVFYKI